MLRAVLAIAFFSACVDAPEDEPDDFGDVGDDGKGDRGDRPAFVEVDPAHSSAAFRTYIRKALTLLENDDSQIARLTAQSIRAGRVKLDELADLTCWDLERLHAEDATVSEVDGYMWSNRIYVARGMPTARLAATLVHEVNHVINRSEVGYWDDFPTSAFVHEYRAFHAEAMFDPEPYEGIDLVDHVIELYELERDAIDPDVLAAPLTPRMLPDATSWRMRRVADDPPDAACP